MIFTKFLIIFVSFVVAWGVADVSSEVPLRLDIYTRSVRAYQGLPLVVTCEVKSGEVLGTVVFTRPGDKKSVLQCDNKFTTKSCTPIVGGYQLSAAWTSGYQMTVESFSLAVDEGPWSCGDSHTPSHLSTVNIRSAPIFKVTHNELPAQKNNSARYFIPVAGVCTSPVPQCKWKIMEAGKSELKNPAGVNTHTFVETCHDDEQANCTLGFYKIPDAFRGKYIIFSVMISHPSIPGNPITPAPSPVLFFPGNNVS
ncbi:uncharacterized protein LOC121386466 [Gigantopelta aegis]|uniref:uncharacterized protein LOC121386466 n=1 Tax=Gigantopelta aegis TaxID=1735272 RepID=UPI001B88974E|nr:uncharacterized protein LOC121386466 [Gigantopelta aegis]